jgi:hypothetical protein
MAMRILLLRCARPACVRYSTKDERNLRDDCVSQACPRTVLAAPWNILFDSLDWDSPKMAINGDFGALRRERPGVDQLGGCLSRPKRHLGSQ